MKSVIFDEIPEDLLGFYTFECGMCGWDYIYQAIPFESKELDNSLCRDIEKSMELSLSEIHEHLNFCPFCFVSPTEEEEDFLLGEYPEYCIYENELVKVFNPEVLPTMYSHSIPKEAIRLYEGNCESCFEYFIYPESPFKASLMTPQLKDILMQAGDIVSQSHLPAMTENASFSFKDDWNCPHCTHLNSFENKWKKAGWGDFKALFSIHQGNLYQVEEEKRVAPKRRESSTSLFSSGYSYATSFSRKDPMDEIQNLLQSNFRPRPSSAGKNLLAAS